MCHCLHYRRFTSRVSDRIRCRQVSSQKISNSYIANNVYHKPAYHKLYSLCKTLYVYTSEVNKKRVSQNYWWHFMTSDTCEFCIMFTNERDWCQLKRQVFQMRRCGPEAFHWPKNFQTAGFVKVIHATLVLNSAFFGTLGKQTKNAGRHFHFHENRKRTR